MAYEKRNLVDKETLIDKELLDHFQDGIISNEKRLDEAFALTTFDPQLFINGTFNYGASSIYLNNKKRVVMSSNQYAETNIYLEELDPLYKITVAYYDSISSTKFYAYNELTSSNLKYIIPKGSYYRIGIKLVSETNAADPADIPTFVGALKFLPTLLSKIQTSEDILKETVPPTTFVKATENFAKELLDYTNENLSEADFRLAVFADSHSDDLDKYKKYDLLNTTGLIDVVLGLGDFQSYTEKGKTLDKYAISQCLNASGRKSNCLYAIGNHETGLIKYVNSGPADETWTLTKKESYDCMQRHLNNIAVVDDVNPYGGYYYVDFPVQKIRVIILNSSDVWSPNDTLDVRYVESVMYQQQQITWFVNTALDFSDKKDTEKWSVLVGVHAPFAKIMISEILYAAKTGANLSTSWSFSNRLLYNSGTGSWSGRDTETIDTFTVSKDYSSQGQIHVIGVFYGHTHEQSNSIQSTIPWLEFPCDNGRIANFYALSVNGITAGEYNFLSENGIRYAFTVTADLTNVTKIRYNKYHTDFHTVMLLDENGNTVKKYNAQTTDSTGVAVTSSSGTELTGFVAERTEGTIMTESGSIVCINKTTKTITTIPYGLGVKSSIQYEQTGYTATFQATSMYSDYGYYSVDGGSTWTPVTMGAVSVENVTEVKLKVTSHEYAMPADWEWVSGSLDGSSANKEVISETITLTEDTTFEYVCYD